MKIRTACRFCIRSTSSSGVWPASPLFPPRHRKAFHEAILDEILQERCGSSRNRANPLAVIFSGIMLLRHVGQDAPAGRLEKAVHRLLGKTRIRTGDLGGRASTTEVTARLIQLMR